MTKVVIDPVARVEGKVKVELDVEGGVVASAKCSPSLYRGFENIVVGRDPRDCAPILSAICGVCHSDHHLASVRAVENAAGMTQYLNNYAEEQTSIPKNAVLSRNTVLGADWAYSHALSILALAGPDYHMYGLLDVLSQSVVVNSYADLLKLIVIPAQQYMHQVIALWGGKAPHQRAAVPGGNPVRPTAELIAQTRARIAQFRSTLDIAVPIIWNYLTANAPTLGSLGAGPGSFLSMGAFQDPTGTNGTERMPLFIPRGVTIFPSATPVSFDPAQVTEDTSLSYYNQSSPQSAIGETTPVPDMTNPQAYTWTKAPRFNGQVCETGPLARECVSGLYQKLGSVIHSVVPSVPGLPLNPKGSVFDRVVARAIEMVALIGSDNTSQNLQALGQPLKLSLVDVLQALGLPAKGLMESWLDAMDVGASTYNPAYKNPDQAEGIGLWEAPRGSLLHWVSIRSQKVANYQVVAPTTWNASPNGPLEAALVGTPVGSSGTDDDFRPTAHVIRSFDLCNACAVHMVDARRCDRYLRLG